MKTFNWKQIISIIAFIGLAGFSCFWTAESLYIWQPSITIYGAWLLAVVFYIIASLCFSRFIKGLEKYGDFDQSLFGSRGGHLFWGLLGLIVFWIGMSLPTNTHTLLYRAAIKEVAMADLTRTQGYLQGLKNNNVEIKKVEDKYNRKKDAVDALLLRLLAEIDHPGYEGIGFRFEKVLVELDRTLFEDGKGSGKIQRIENVGSTRPQWVEAVRFYQSQAHDQLKLYRERCDEEITEIKSMMGSELLDGLINNCKKGLSDVSRMENVDNEIIKAANKDLDEGYSYIKSKSQYVDFKNPDDKERYTREIPTTEIKEMQDISAVWRDFLSTDKYDKHGFVWWVLISILVDLSAFVFFNLAFSKDEQ